MKRWIVSIVAVVLLGLLAGCSGRGKSSGPVETIELTANAMAFGSRELTLEQGKTYRLVFNNSDAVEHDFAIDKIPVKIVTEGHEAGHGSSPKKADLHVHSDAGKKESVEFTPTEAGTYTFYCTVAGHKDAGMVGQLVVK